MIALYSYYFFRDENEVQAEHNKIQRYALYVVLPVGYTWNSNQRNRMRVGLTF